MFTVLYSVIAVITLFAGIILYFNVENLSGNEIGVHLSYRHYTKEYNDRWNGVVGGVTFRPEFAKNCRVIAEYTGSDINVGIDCLLLKHWLMQASLQSGKYFSGGICYKLNLF